MWAWAWLSVNSETYNAITWGIWLDIKKKKTYGFLNLWRPTSHPSVCSLTQVSLALAVGHDTGPKVKHTGKIQIQPRHFRLYYLQHHPTPLSHKGLHTPGSGPYPALLHIYSPLQKHKSTWAHVISCFCATFSFNVFWSTKIVKFLAGGNKLCPWLGNNTMTKRYSDMCCSGA